ncbi:MAG: helix-turn-helix domain-containing protein [Eubacteriales bacterium]|nr:helix-turn-helix domain-containing protein [Eubacteriales bacterium]
MDNYIKGYIKESMKENMLSIGKMAELNRVTVPTLRLYDENGILKPSYVDPDTGYRYYDRGQCARLDMISYMKELGMSLSEISAVLEKEDVTAVEQILIMKNEQLHQQMRVLKYRHAAVERAIASIERYRKSPVIGTISLEYIDRRTIIAIPCRVNFYASTLRDYELMLAELRNTLSDRGIEQVHTYSVGTSIRQEDFEKGSFVADKIFIFGDKELKEQSLPSSVLDSGMHACIYLDDYDREIDYANKLKEYCRENNYIISGDYICEVLTEFNIFDSQKRNMFLRLQVPVTFKK